MASDPREGEKLTNRFNFLHSTDCVWVVEESHGISSNPIQLKGWGAGSE